MTKPEEFVFTQTIKCADCDGVPIKEGSVIKEINDGDCGVVVQIVRPNQCGPMFSQVGDVVIQTGRSRGSSRVTNRYNQWKHVPHNEQTYEQRFLSWQLRDYVYDDWLKVSEGEALAMDGIMSLLPDDIVDEDYGPYPDNLDNVLTFLVQHLESLIKKDE